MSSFLLYVAAAVAYIVLGVVFPDLLLSWVNGVVFLLVAVCVLPSLFRRLR